jgi:hypothetical protein
MNFVAHYILFNLYGLFFCLDDLYEVFSEFISSRSKIGEKKYTELCYISVKYVVHHI